MREVHRKERLWLPPSAKKDGGSYFDDELQTAQAVEDARRMNSLNMRMELNSREGCRIMVGTSNEAVEMNKVITYWCERGELTHRPTVHVNASVPPGSVQVVG